MLLENTPKFFFKQARYKRGAPTLDKIKLALLEEIYTNGLFRTSVCKVSEHANVTRGAFYNYWSSIEECLIDLLFSYEEINKSKEKKFFFKKEKVHSSLLSLVSEVLYIYPVKELGYQYFPLLLLNEKRIDNKELLELLLDSVGKIRQNWINAILEDQSAHLILEDVVPTPTAVALLNFTSGIIQNVNHDTKSEILNAPLKIAMENFVHNLFYQNYMEAYKKERIKTLQI